jgi:hypothetical protein
VHYFYLGSQVINSKTVIERLKAVLNKIGSSDNFTFVYQQIDKNWKWIEKNLKDVDAWLDSKKV